MLTTYEAGLCSCGQPVVLAHHEDNDGWYSAEKSQCHSCAARERATAGTKNEAYVPEPGEKVYTKFTRDLVTKPLRNHSSLSL